MNKIINTDNALYKLKLNEKVYTNVFAAREFISLNKICNELKNTDTLSEKHYCYSNFIYKNAKSADEHCFKETDGGTEMTIGIQVIDDVRPYELVNKLYRVAIDTPCVRKELKERIIIRIYASALKEVFGLTIKEN